MIIIYYFIKIILVLSLFLEKKIMLTIIYILIVFYYIEIFNFTFFEITTLIIYKIINNLII